MTGVPIKGGEETQKWTCIEGRWYEDTGRIPCDDKGIGMIHLEAKEHQEFPARPEAERKAWNRFSSRTLKENTVLPKPWFWTSGVRNCERIIFCFKPLIFWHSYHSPRKQYNSLIQSTTVSLCNYQEHPNWSCKHRLFFHCSFNSEAREIF